MVQNPSNLYCDEDRIIVKHIKETLEGNFITPYSTFSFSKSFGKIFRWYTMYFHLFNKTGVWK